MSYASLGGGPQVSQGSPAGAIASLVCYTYELDYLNRCLKKWKAMDPTDPGYAEMHARTLFAMLSRRYIDDNLHVLIDFPENNFSA